VNLDLISKEILKEQKSIMKILYPISRTNMILW